MKNYGAEHESVSPYLLCPYHLNVFLAISFFIQGCFKLKINLKIPVRDVACSAGVYFGRTNVFAHESAMLKLPEER